MARNPLIKMLPLALGVAVACYALLLLLAFLGQRALIYPAPQYGREPSALGARLERIACPRLGTVYATYLPAAAQQPTVVHFHGNGEELADQDELIDHLGRRGLGVLAVEYPGYGLDRANAATEANLYLAADCALTHVKNALGVAPQALVVQGQSLGSGVAVEMARRGHAAGLVLISPFTSLVHLGTRVAPFLPASLLLRDRYDSLAKVSQLNLPALVIHGTDDEVIPFAMGERIAAALPRAQLLRVEGARHNDLFFRDAERLLDAITSFAREATRPAG